MDSPGATTLSRQQLYELIWKEPTRTVAQRLGISDVGLAKTCRKLLIPRPWRGYWREKETGHKPRQPKLTAWPAHVGKEPEAITFRPAPSPSDSPPRPPEPETVERQRAYEAVPEHQIEVAGTLTEPHRLVRRAARLFKRPGDRDLLWPSERPCLDIHVSKESLDRALRIFDAILNAAHARGWSVATQTEHPFLTQVTVLGELVAISVTEKMRQVERPHPPKKDTTFLLARERYGYESTGLLTIRLTGGTSFTWNARTWNDGKRQRVESCLHDVMIGFVELAEGRKAARREEERRQLERMEAERRRFAAAERRERENDRRGELQRQIETWSRVHEVRAYVAALLEAAKEHVLHEPDGRLARWLRWAHAYAEHLDPLAELGALPLNPGGYGRPPLDLESFGLIPAEVSASH
ncbi:MAG: hypothetical protein ACREMZ_10100 [Gemmatimonadales bacterium]